MQNKPKKVNSVCLRVPTNYERLHTNIRIMTYAFR